ncbi:MAG: DUF2207 domain-containing protein [Candidatus Omnitrophica bacterium]|nr:DUF2207 domain-containing protein [Candidatus Omnitrophota bacterium]
MKKRIFLSLVSSAVFFGLLAPGILCAQGPSAERILSFDSAIEVHEDASMTVTETITVVSAGQQIKHGIYRDFPTRYEDRYGNRYVVGFSVLEVRHNGGPVDYFLKTLSNGVRLYIGNKDIFISPGEHTYTIIYRTDRQLGFFEDVDELYWNVTGNGWGFPIEEASATVGLPGDAAHAVLSYGGYTGPAGSRQKNLSVSNDMYGRTTFRTTRRLAPGEGLTIFISWPKGYVTEPTLLVKIGFLLRDNLGILIGLGGLLLLFIYYLMVWGRVGRDPAKGTIIPLFNPPQGLSPAAMRYIMKMGFDNKSFTASLINMAVKGYVKISETGGSYSIEKTGGNEEMLTPEEKKIARALLGGLGRIDLKNTNHTRIKDAIKKLEATLKQGYEKIYFFTNQNYFIPGAIFSVLIMIGSSALVAGEELPIALFMSAWLTIWSFGVMALMQQIILLWRSAASGGRNTAAAFGMTIFGVPFLAGEVFGIVMLVSTTSFSIVLLLLIVVGLNGLFYHLLKAPTFKGRKVMDKIEGFKMYLLVAEKERLNLLTPPERTPELFEKFLPYALALDVEQAWAEQFADVLARAGAHGEEYRPGWYSGHAWNRFNPGGFVSGLGSSFSSAVSSASTPPGSSSGGGGGGFSGGGGGGGGGGGW